MNKAAEEARAKFLERNSVTEMPTIPAAPKWTSTIHSKDYTQPHKEHIKFMHQFQPHPDDASAWLYNEPKVDLLGAKHD